jgi:hypothetical protein
MYLVLKFRLQEKEWKSLKGRFLVFIFQIGSYNFQHLVSVTDTDLKLVNNLIVKVAS